MNNNEYNNEQPNKSINDLLAPESNKTFNNTIDNNQNNMINNTFDSMPNNSVNNLLNNESNNVVNNTFNNNQNSNVNNSFNNKSSERNIGKILKVIIVILVILAVGVFAYFKLIKKEDASLSNITSAFDINTPILITENNKYGYIDNNGKVLIKPQYLYAEKFYGNYAIVTAESTSEKAVSGRVYQVIDRKGNVMFTSSGYNEPKYYADYNVWLINDLLYDGNLKRLVSEKIKMDYIDQGYFTYDDYDKNESGIMKYDTTKVFTMKDTGIYASISVNDDNKDDLYAVVTTFDPDREFIVSLKTGDILFESENTDDYYLTEESDGIFKYYNRKTSDGFKNRKYLYFKDNKLVYETTEVVEELKVYNYKNQILEIDYGSNYISLGKLQRFYYYDLKTKTFTTDTPASVTNEDLLVKQEETYGFRLYDNNGKFGLKSGDTIVLPCEYSQYEIEFVNKNLFKYMKTKGKELIILTKDNKEMLYDVKNSEAIYTTDSKNDIQDHSSTFIEIETKDDNKVKTGYIIYNILTGQSITVDKDVIIFFYETYITVYKDKITKYYNVNLKEIYEIAK